MNQSKAIRRLAAALLASALVATSVPTASVHAETSAEVRQQVAQAQEELSGLTQQMEDARSRADELDQQVEELADESITIQGQLIEDRGHLKRMVAASYKANSGLSYLDMILSSRSIDELVSTIRYTQHVSDWETDCIAALESDKEELSARIAEMNAAREEQEAALAELDEARDSLEGTIENLESYADQLEEEEREAARRAAEEARRKAEAEAKRKAEEEARRKAEEEAARKAAEEEAARKAAEEEAARKAAEEEAQQAAEEEQPSEEEAQSSEEETDGESDGEGDEGEAAETSETDESGGGWITCVASAYTIADNDPPGSTATSSGIPLDESVPTVAMPMSMDPSRFYGRKIEISYEGMSVIATVTDCGAMDGGNRGLDLTPAIFRAFGFGDADSWGLRTVQYRFI